MALTIFSLVIDAGVVPPRSGPFPYFVAVQNGLTSALCTCLVVNGFVGFQLYEDGTALSVWLLRITSLMMFAISFVVSILTFQSYSGLSPTNTAGLFVTLYLLNAICIVVYLAMQLLLVMGTLDDRWPLGHIAFGVLVFAVGQVLLYAFSDTICENVQHYMDGLFFATICNLLAVMMVYKVSRRHTPFCSGGPCLHSQYWDSITKEDLEFSVGIKPNTWEVKEPLPDDSQRPTSYFPDTNSEYTPSMYHHQASTYGGYNH